MNAVGSVVSDLYRGEQRLADELIAASDRHRDEHELHHVARDLHRWSEEHLRRLAGIAGRYGQDLDGGPRDEAPSLGALRDEVAGSENLHLPSGLLVLRDLRVLYLMASDNSLHWEMLAQAAQARRDTDLLRLVSACHPQTLRQIRWANTLIKTMSPQILTSLTGG